jgi:hypothetical protein
MYILLDTMQTGGSLNRNLLSKAARMYIMCWDKNNTNSLQKSFKLKCPFKGSWKQSPYIRPSREYAGMDASMEWFGPNVKSILAKDCRGIKKVIQVEEAR